MSCTGCGSSFGLLKKEVGCGTCGFSFCTKCCSKKSLTDVSGQRSKQLVCNKCYNNLTSDNLPTTSCSPPLAHKKRMAKLNNRSMSLGSSTYDNNSAWNNEKDKEIAERLQKLKRERNKEIHPSQLEIEERLAKLKGMDPANYTAPPIMVYRPADKRSSIEQSSDLMKQIVEEVQLDAKQVKPEDEIAARLAKLRGEPVAPKPVAETIVPSTYTQGTSSNQDEAMDIDHESHSMAEEYKILVQQAHQEIGDLNQMKEYKDALKQMKKEPAKDSDEDVDEDEEADKIVERLLAVKMDSTEMDDPESLNGGPVHSSDDANKKEGSDEDQEEFPWCVICTEDAKIRCFGCDSDLYCMNCFRDCHDSLDIKDHKTCPFLSPKKDASALP